MLSTRAFHLTALVFGLIAAGALTTAVATDYWIFTSEPIKIVAEGLWEMMVVVKTHSGLWRSCTYNDGLPGSIRWASPFMLASLITLSIGLVITIIGNLKNDIRTLLGITFYVFSAIMLSVGVIFFIIGVNDEAAYHRKSIYEGPPFTYSYGWAFYLTGIAFMAILAAIATNIMLYERRHPYPKDMVGNSPELEEKSKFDFSEVEDKGHAEPGTH